jgi:hypothetical protein
MSSTYKPGPSAIRAPAVCEIRFLVDDSHRSLATSANLKVVKP